MGSNDSNHPSPDATTLINPATEEPLGTVARHDTADLDRAVARALTAQRAWAAQAPGDRARLLRAFAAAVDADREHLALLEIANAGHPIESARWEAGNVRDVLDFAAGMPERLAGAQIPVAGGIDLTFHEPMGVVGVIAPWNFPMPIASWAFGPALAAGNAVILKPAERTPLTSRRLAELGLAAGLPDGLFQVLTGTGATLGAAMVAHPDIPKLVFTGSTAVGRTLQADAARHVKRVTLELGGKSANVVFADADIEAVAAAAPGSVFDNAGQDCCARSRILVEASVFDRFLAALEPAVRAWRVGDPRRTETQMGPLISAEHRATVAEFVPDDRWLAFRGTAPTGPGYWFPPTVLTPPADHPTVREEIFGPVVTVVPFRDEAEAITLANATDYGLSGSIWTSRLDRAVRVSRAVRSGTLSVNSHASVRYHTPFGGMKQSGLGRELGPDAALAFTETKNVFFAIPDAPSLDATDPTPPPPLPQTPQETAP